MLSNLLLATTAATSASALSPLFLDTPPSHSQPYAIKRFAPAKAVAVGQQIYRFPVTGASSDGKFSLLSTSAPSSNDLGVPPTNTTSTSRTSTASKAASNSGPTKTTPKTAAS